MGGAAMRLTDLNGVPAERRATVRHEHVLEIAGKQQGFPHAHPVDLDDYDHVHFVSKKTSRAIFKREYLEAAQQAAAQEVMHQAHP
jgi:hypothetical protein